jgi:TPR repeat protein
MSLSTANLELTPAKWPSIQRLAKRNVPDAMYLMGVAYLLGGLVDADSKRSYFWFCKAANLRHPDAAFRAGFLLQHGRVEDPTTTADMWFLKAEELQSPAGLCAMGNRWTYQKLNQQRWWHKYWSRSDSSPEAVAAYERYRKATQVSSEYPAAHYYLGVHTLKGWGTAKNKAQAMEYFEKAVEHRDRDAAFALALCHSYNSPEYWMRMEQAADLGNSEAQYKLALALLARRTTESATQAVNWLRKASIQRNPKAMLLLSQTFAYGRTLPVDLPNAWRWARRCQSLGGCSQNWVDKLFRKIPHDEQATLANESVEDDKDFHAMSMTLFGAPGSF